MEPITIIGVLVAAGWGIGKIRKWRREQASDSGWAAGEGRVFSDTSSSGLSGGSGTDGGASSGDHGGGHGGDCGGHGHGGGDCGGHGGCGGGHGW